MASCCAPACSQALPVKPQGVWARGSEAWAGSRDLRNLEFVRWGSSGPSSLMYVTSLWWVKLLLTAPPSQCNTSCLCAVMAQLKRDTIAGNLKYLVGKRATEFIQNVWWFIILRSTLGHLQDRGNQENSTNQNSLHSVTPSPTLSLHPPTSLPPFLISLLFSFPSLPSPRPFIYTKHPSLHPLISPPFTPSPFHSLYSFTSFHQLPASKSSTPSLHFTLPNLVLSLYHWPPPPPPLTPSLIPLYH